MIEGSSICTSTTCSHETMVCRGCPSAVCRWTLDERGECVWCERRRLRERAPTARAQISDAWGLVELVPGTPAQVAQLRRDAA